MPRQSDRPTGPLDDARALSTVEKTLSPGSMLGSRYKILSVLGFGGMGVVYRALDLTLDLEIALKRLRPDKMSAEKRQILRREIILSRMVTHENVCRIYDLQEIDGVEYVSMEFIPGRQLKEIEESEGVLPLGRGLSIAKGLCRGLAAAHNIGVLHRDLKPENVIVDERGRPRLMDFGIAIEKSRTTTEKSGSVPGTPQFLAPELLRGAAPDARSDIYALGVLLFEMFTGRVPFDDGDTNKLVKKVLHESPPEISTLRPDLPPELATILRRAIAKDPAARFGSAEEVATAIEAYEGAFLDKALREVSVARAKSVKLMVMLEANKALAATLDSTEILRIILKTATQETDAERGTIFLVEPETRVLVSQILEGGEVAPIRVPWGQGIAGACAAEGRPILTTDVDADPRHDRGPDSTSGFKTHSILAAPMKTLSGEVVGVIEVLNKRKNAFSREDEEFLAAVAEHAALAVANSREHQQAVREAAASAQGDMLRALRPMLFPAKWPDTPGFESEPLRWRSGSPHLLGYQASYDGDSLTLAILEDSRTPPEGIVDLLSAISELRASASGANLGELVASLGQRVERVVAARLSSGSFWFCSSGAPLPFLYRDGRPTPFDSHSEGDLRSARALLESRDLVLIPSEGLVSAMGDRTGELESQLQRAAKLARNGTIAGTFTDLVSRWKAEGKHPGEKDLLLLGARRL